MTAANVYFEWPTLNESVKEPKLPVSERLIPACPINPPLQVQLTIQFRVCLNMSIMYILFNLNFTHY